MIRRLIILLLIGGCVFAREYIAIIDFEGISVSEADAKALTQRLTSEMITLELYQVLERSEMKRLLDEQKFQYSGCVDLKCAVELGKMLGAKYMVVGSVSKVGSSYSIDSRMIDVESSEAYISANFTHKGEIDILLTSGIVSIAKQLCELEGNPQDTLTPSPSPSSSQSPLPSPPSIPSPIPPQITKPIYNYCVGNDICLTINNHINSDKVFDIIMANNIEVSGFTFDITGINIASVNGGLLYNNKYEIKYTSLELEWDDKGLGYYSAKGFQAYSLKGTEIQPSNDILTTITYSGIPNKVCINAKIVDSDAMPLNTKNPECIDLNK